MDSFKLMPRGLEDKDVPDNIITIEERKIKTRAHINKFHIAVFFSF